MQDNDFGFSFVDQTNINKLKKDSSNGIEAAKYFYQQMQLMKRTIFPLLEKLSETPEKDIHWPNRDQKMKELMKKIEEISTNNPFHEIVM
jgi:preprotein translocase subunit SecE